MTLQQIVANAYKTLAAARFPINTTPSDLQAALKNTTN